MSTNAVVQRTVTVASKVGLHARPAKLVASAAAELPAVVHIGTEGKDPVDARSLLLLLSLGVEHGDTVTLRAEGEQAAEAVDRIAELLAQEHPDGS